MIGERDQIMEIAFVIIFILASHLIYSVASDQRTGFNPYPFGTTILCLLLHPLLLTLSIWYLGWIWGIVIFLCHLFGLIHATVSWILELPTLLAKTERQVFGFMKLKIGLLTPMLIVTLVFTILSFFMSHFKSLFYLLGENIAYIITIAVVAVVGGIVRAFVSKSFSNKY